MEGWRRLGEMEESWKDGESMEGWRRHRRQRCKYDAIYRVEFPVNSGVFLKFAKGRTGPN